MNWTPNSSGRKQKRKELSPDWLITETPVQKRVDNKNSPPPIMASLVAESEKIAEAMKESPMKLVAPIVPNPLTPDWAQQFQDSFFKKLQENTEEVQKLTKLTGEVKKSQEHLDLEVEDIKKDLTKEKAKMVVAEAKIEDLEGICEGLSKKMSLLEEQVLKGDVKSRYNNLIFYGIQEKLLGSR